MPDELTLQHSGSVMLIFGGPSMETFVKNRSCRYLPLYSLTLSNSVYKRETGKCASKVRIPEARSCHYYVWLLLRLSLALLAHCWVLLTRVKSFDILVPETKVCFGPLMISNLGPNTPHLGAISVLLRHREDPLFSGKLEDAQKEVKRGKESKLVM